MQVIPAIDIIDGKCVRLTEGDYSSKTEYASSPLEMAKRYADHGIHRLHLVDLDGAKSGKVINWKVAEEIASETNLELDFGGGVKSIDDVKRILDLGIAYVTIGSVAARQPELFLHWTTLFGADRFFLGADVRDEKIMVGGWQEQSALELFSFLSRYVGHGIQHVFCTDVSKDGRLEGPSTFLYKKIKTAFPEIRLVASGGVSCLHDLDALEEAGCDGVIIGKAIYENRISLEELASYINQPKD
jgi:phosphoribosylformimino-5-aminoimidazole carboxamide ribotide isomerase